MPGPIPIEVRTRAVAAHEAGLGTLEEVAKMFRVGSASVNRWLRLDREQGSLVSNDIRFCPPGDIRN